MVRLDIRYKIVHASLQYWKKKITKKRTIQNDVSSYAITSNKHINEGANRFYTCRATIWTLQINFMDFNSHFKISITIILWKNVQIGNEEIKIYDGKSIKLIWRDQTSRVHVNRNRAKLYHVQSLTTCTGTIFIFLFFSSNIDWRFNWRPIFNMGRPIFRTYLFFYRLQFI